MSAPERMPLTAGNARRSAGRKQKSFGSREKKNGGSGKNRRRIRRSFVWIKR